MAMDPDIFFLQESPSQYDQWQKQDDVLDARLILWDIDDDALVLLGRQSV
jgi:hypothetical protein